MDATKAIEKAKARLEANSSLSESVQTVAAFVNISEKNQTMTYLPVIQVIVTREGKASFAWFGIGEKTKTAKLDAALAAYWREQRASLGLPENPKDIVKKFDNPDAYTQAEQGEVTRWTFAAVKQIQSMGLNK